MKSLDNGSCLDMFIQLYPQQHNMSHYGNLLFSMSKFMDKIVWAVTIILLQKVKYFFCLVFGIILWYNGTMVLSTSTHTHINLVDELFLEDVMTKTGKIFRVVTIFQIVRAVTIIWVF